MRAGVTIVAEIPGDNSRNQVISKPASVPKLKLVSNFEPTGDQPEAIEKLAQGLKAGLKHQVLLGVTGSGKTFTMANVIQNIQTPALVISHNKTLAAQLFQEYRDFFPKNAVEYFVSYYDYYQPEAYIPQTDTYIAKDAGINEFIDKLRLSATTSIMTRNDIIVVASVSCIYNMGSPTEYATRIIELAVGMELCRENLIKRLLHLYYQRNDYHLKRSAFRVKGELVDFWPSYTDFLIRLEILDNRLVKIQKIDPLSGNILENLKNFSLYPAKHFITAEERKKQAIKAIQRDLKKQTAKLKKQGKNLEAYRLEQRTNYDLELISEIGYCSGIENYSRYFDGRAPGEPPFTLLDFFTHRFGKDFLIIIDESHMTIPQIRGMYEGDRARKQTLIDYGFRLPSALDNRPLRFDEFLKKAPQIIYTSATPGKWEVNKARAFKKGIVEQLIRPTGLLDPEIKVRSIQNQIENLVDEIIKRTKKRERVLVTTLTKRLAEDLTEYLSEQGIKACYLHADVDTLDRLDILENLRRGKYDVVVGINLLREGLDLPEVSLVAILDADKEGFLRSATSLIQVMGRAARHINGEVIMYADKITNSMQEAIDEINRRREIQVRYNAEHGIKPKSIRKPIREKVIERKKEELTKKTNSIGSFLKEDRNLTTSSIAELEQQMLTAAKNLEFEKAAFLRDKIEELKKI
ncbi:excinuclease ABC subunit B [candidate division CPR3 bacterium 4484_211]|uniref:UvrABC system protein B n=1 Tax=candidate division CPR3 bacterium 4484_211 TaxID=1968527 RepID=A0A1W9NZ43_UNCC3|nr:MAG: excinuclease ABC subunit B [candidate division CPR3 bacterium 4484_211]